MHFILLLFRLGFRNKTFGSYRIRIKVLFAPPKPLASTLIFTIPKKNNYWEWFMIMNSILWQLGITTQPVTTDLLNNFQETHIFMELGLKDTHNLIRIKQEHEYSTAFDNCKFNNYKFECSIDYLTFCNLPHECNDTFFFIFLTSFSVGEMCIWPFLAGLFGLQYRRSKNPNSHDKCLHRWRMSSIFWPLQISVES